MSVNKLSNLSKQSWIIIIFIIAGVLSTFVGVSVHIDTLQFQEIATSNDKIHDLELHAAVLNARVGFLADLVRDLRTQHFSGDDNNSNNDSVNSKTNNITLVFLNNIDT